MNTIIIYGPGCAKCAQVLESTKFATAQLGGEFNIKKVSDPMQFAVAGVFMTPALSLNGKLLFSGRTPSAEELKEMLSAELGNDEKSENYCGGSSCGCNSKKEAAPAPAAGCGCGSSCSGEKGTTKPNPCKKLLLWVVIIVIALAVVKTINRSNKEEIAPDSASAASVASDALTLTYYKLGVECITCQRMDKWINEAVTTNFAEQLASGQLVLQCIKPTEEQVAQYQLTTKTLIANKGETWSNLDQIWVLKDDESAFKAYIVTETQKLLK